MDTPVYLAACGVRAGSFAALALTAEGTPVWHSELDARAHDIAVNPTGDTCLIVDRKPGKGARLCRLSDGQLQFGLLPLPNHSFDGHAVFSADGATVFTTQSAERTQAGRIVVYNVVTGALVRDFSSHGIEPHELFWATPNLLAIGNGGIVDRHAADAIDSSLVLIDAGDGQPHRRWVLDDEWETLSIRHLAILPDGRIVFAMQDQDSATDQRPLVGLARIDGELSFLALPSAVHRRLDGYIGSVAVDCGGLVIAASAPRAGLTLFWSAASGDYLGAAELTDVCGLSATHVRGGFRLNSGHGRQIEVDVHPTKGVLAVRDMITASALGLQWDNHMSRCRA